MPAGRVAHVQPAPGVLTNVRMVTKVEINLFEKLFPPGAARRRRSVAQDKKPDLNGSPLTLRPPRSVVSVSERME